MSGVRLLCKIIPEQGWCWRHEMDGPPPLTHLWVESHFDLLIETHYSPEFALFTGVRLIHQSSHYSPEFALFTGVRLIHRSIHRSSHYSLALDIDGSTFLENPPWPEGCFYYDVSKIAFENRKGAIWARWRQWSPDVPLAVCVAPHAVCFGLKTMAT